MQKEEIEQKFQNIPNNIRLVMALLINDGYQAYLVGGCVRDHLINRQVSDYDIATNATPEQVQGIFPRTFYENTFGTVGVVTCDIDEKDTEIIKDSIVEVTTYRAESDYKDKRHPENVSYIDNINEDLKRRDFTINAMAYNPITSDFIDNYEGIKDISIGQIRCVGNPDDRFQEDSLRILRAIRFSAQLGWTISQETLQSIKNNHFLLKSVSYERIRDEFSKIIMTKNPMKAIINIHELNILQYISPELENGIGVTQNHAHKYDV
ncbi:MAG: CCA tRNA nucleotidyltransferase [Candidatus Pacebacteria bacterium]|nr:CCA tRNA nucleotidyltransferase [Candidatus Paceibacterota bacterium]